MVDVLGYIKGAGGAIVRTVTPYINQGVRIVTQPPIRTIAPIVTQAPRVIGQVAAPVVRQAVRTAAPMMQTIQRSPAMLPAVVGARIGRAAAPHIARAVQQAPRVIQRSPAQVIAPALFHGSQQVARLTAPAVRQAVRTAAPVMQTIQRSPAMLPAVVGARIGRAAAPVIASAVRQAPQVLARSPAQVLAPAIMRIPGEVARVAAPAVRQGVQMAQRSPQILGPAALPVVVGMGIARAAAPAIAQAPRILSRAPIDVLGPAIVRAPQIIAQAAAPAGRQIGTLAQGAVRIAASPALSPVRISLLSQGNLTTGNVQQAQNLIRDTNRVTSGAGIGPIALPGIGGASPAASPAVNVTPAASPAAQIRQQGAPTGSIDPLGHLARGDVIGAVGAAGNWVVHTVPPAAEATGNWIANGPINWMNLNANRPLEEGRYPRARAWDAGMREIGRNPVARTVYTALMHHPPEYDTTVNLGRTGRLVTNDFWGNAGGMVALGVAGGTLYAGNVVGRLWNRDPVGAATVAGEGVVNAATGTVDWGLGIPGRIAANPARGTVQVLGELAAGEFLFGGAARGIRGVKSATVRTVGRPLGLYNPDVLVVSGRKFGVPQDSPFRQVENILTNPRSYNVIHTSRQPLTLLPKGKIFAEAGEGATVPKQFFTYGNRQTGITSDIFFSRKLGDLPLAQRASNAIFGPRINLMPSVRNVELPGGLRKTALDEMRTRGAMREPTYRQIEQHAREQSIRYGEPVFMPSPKRMKAQISRIENEGIAVFGNDAARTVSQNRFGGYTRSGVRITQVAFGSQALPGSRIGTLAYNARSSFNLGISRHAGARNLGLYHRPTVDFFAEQANYKIDVLTGRRQVSPREAQFDLLGRDHVTEVRAGLDWERRTNPAVRENLSPVGARIMSVAEDAGKFWRQDQMYPSARLAAIGLETGRFPALRRDFENLPRGEQRTITRALRQHDTISPNTFTGAGIRTALISRPDAVGRALFNADQLPGMPQFGAGPGRLAVIRNWMFDQSFHFTPFPELTTWGLRRPQTRGQGLGDLLGDLRGRGRKPAAAEVGYSGYRRGRTTGRAIAAGGIGSNVETGARLYERARASGSGYGVGRSRPRSLEYTADPFSYDRPHASTMAAGALSYGEGVKISYPRGYGSKYRPARGYSTGYRREGYGRNYPPKYPPDTYKGKYPPSDPPTYRTGYPPSYPPSYPPGYPPSYPPSYPPGYPPSYPPNYPPSNPPYPPYKPPRIPPYPPTTPPNRPPYPPTTPPMKPPYPPTTPPNRPPYPPTIPPTKPPYPPYQPPYEPPYPPMEPPIRMDDIPDGRQGRSGGNLVAWDFGERLGVYDPARMFGKRTKKDRIFGMTYTRRKKKGKSFLG